MIHTIRRIRHAAELARVYRQAISYRNVGGLDVIICSPGGVATTMLLEHVAKYLRTNAVHDQDTLKHVPDPILYGLNDASGVRVLFVHGKPDQITRSIQRRGWIRIQGAKLGEWRMLTSSRGRSITLFREAVERQIERFAAVPGKAMMSVRFNELWDRLEEIERFLGLDGTDFRETFPPRKGRATEG